MHLEVERDNETETEREVEEDLDWRLDASHGGMGHVIVHNDDVTSFEFVIGVLASVFELPGGDAERVAVRAHVTGQAFVATYPMEEAKYRVGRAHGAARAAGYPLTFTIEPAD